MPKSDDSSRQVREPRGIGRYFEGWQPGLLAVLLAGGMAILAVPRSVEPVELPVPIANPRELQRMGTFDDALARSVLQTPLDPDVRALGSLLRAFGKADAKRDDAMLVQLRSRLGPAVAAARAQGDAQLLGLRAFQMKSFLAEVRHFVATGEVSPELTELGGPFADVLKTNQWCRGAHPCAMRMGEHALRAAFKRRWNEISGLSGSPFELSLDEQRALYQFLLQNPPVKSASSGAPQDGRPDASFLLKKVDELYGFDASYPRELARGIVHYQKGDYRRAAEFFSKYLEASPNGPWTLRAQNHLRAALERSLGDTP